MIENSGRCWETWFSPDQWPTWWSQGYLLFNAVGWGRIWRARWMFYGAVRRSLGFLSPRETLGEFSAIVTVVHHYNYNLVYGKQSGGRTAGTFAKRGLFPSTYSCSKSSLFVFWMSAVENSHHISTTWDWLMHLQIELWTNMLQGRNWDSYKGKGKMCGQWRKKYDIFLLK